MDSRPGIAPAKPAFRYAVEREYVEGVEPPLWIRNGYDDARELLGLPPETWPAPWEL